MQLASTPDWWRMPCAAASAASAAACAAAGAPADASSPYRRRASPSSPAAMLASTSRCTKAHWLFCGGLHGCNRLTILAMGWDGP